MNEEEMIVGGEFQDETIVCKECGKEFVFTAGEQAFYKEKGFQNKPKCCKECRSAKKNGGKPREFFMATCSQCGGEAKLPFKPTSDHPVYCSACFEAIKASRG